LSPNSLAGSPAMSGIVAEANDAESVFAAPAGMSRLEGTNMTVHAGHGGSLPVQLRCGREQDRGGGG
jgi:long-subunit fatty acid transport protein